MNDDATQSQQVTPAFDSSQPVAAQTGLYDDSNPVVPQPAGNSVPPVFSNDSGPAPTPPAYQSSSDGAAPQPVSDQSVPQSSAPAASKDELLAEAQAELSNTFDQSGQAPVPAATPVQAPTQMQQNTIQPPVQAQAQAASSQDQSDMFGISNVISDSQNILITVNRNPTIDELSSAIGLSLVLDGMGKKPTAIYSGRTPHAIQFLEPENTFQDDVSSLRDFIISLDKSKADRLRYKVDNESGTVRIFVTPYKNRITSEDLSFSEGDYNVDTIVALGIKDRNDFDEAILSHGRVLHDAKIVTVNSGEAVSALGTINWDEPKASSISEMMVNLADNISIGSVDSQTATCFMTGIVAATDRFSNLKTTPEVMQVASRLMSAGANQQLISSSVSSTGISINNKQGSSDRAKKATEELVLDHPSDDKTKKDVAKSSPQSDKPKNQSGAKDVSGNSNKNSYLDKARNEVTKAEEASLGSKKQAVGLQGSLSLDNDKVPSLEPASLEVPDSSVQAAQSDKADDIASDKIAPMVGGVTKQDSAVNKATDVNNEQDELGLPPLPPMPPLPNVDGSTTVSQPNITPEIPGLDLPPLGTNTNISSPQEKAKVLAQERNNKFNALYGEDPNAI